MGVVGAGGAALELALTGQHDADTFLGKSLSLFDNCWLLAPTGSGGYTNVFPPVGCYVSRGSVVTVLDFEIGAG